MSEAGDAWWVAAPDGWREACFLLPACRALARRGPVNVLSTVGQRRFWELAGFEVVEVSAKAGAKDFANVARLLVWEDGAVAKAAAKAGVAQRVGPATDGLRKRLTRPVEVDGKPGPPVHRVRRFLAVVEVLGAEAMRAENFAPIEVAEPKLRPGTWLVVPDSDFGRNHEWEVDRWFELLEWLGNAGVAWELGGDGPLARTLGEWFGVGREGIDPAAAPETLAGLGACLAADGSVPHVAAAFGTRCAVLFGPGEPALVRPLGRQHLAVRRRVECSPCFLTKCPIDLRCQRELEVETVKKAVGEWAGIPGT